MTHPPAARGRARDLGFPCGVIPTGPLNAITDVPRVRVGQHTLWQGDPDGDTPVVRTGVTAIWPHDGNPFRERVYAATSVFNGYGILTGDIVMDEWGLLGSPIVLCDTANVGISYDAIVRYMTAMDSAVGDDDVIMPVVAECDDGFLNDNRAFALTQDHVIAALDAASDGSVAEGVVGAGTGTQQFDYKGGIGTSSRVVEVGGTLYTIGILLNTNYASRYQLQIAGVPLGRTFQEEMPVRHKEGSCIAVIATDLPLHPKQLKRLARRVDIGLGLTGSVGNDGSGEIFMAFSTAHRVPRHAESGTIPLNVMVEGQFWTHGSPFDAVFDAVVEASTEAALNAMCQADTVVGRDGHRLAAFPIGAALDAIHAR